MFWRTLCAFALLAAPAAGEFVVRDGDYYEELTPTIAGLQPVRITGGRVDRLLGFGGSLPVTIDGALGRFVVVGTSNYTFAEVFRSTTKCFTMTGRWLTRT